MKKDHDHAITLVYWSVIGGIYWDNGKENGNHSSILGSYWGVGWSGLGSCCPNNAASNGLENGK